MADIAREIAFAVNKCTHALEVGGKHLGKLADFVAHKTLCHRLGIVFRTGTADATSEFGNGATPLPASHQPAQAESRIMMSEPDTR